MKNIHLIETNKPSRLCINGKNCQHIYITNDEEIKDGWSYDRMMKSIGKRNNVYSSKIILTTDVDLIKDGVQTIDDEFLEWFVKNPSCESVKTQRWYDGYTFGYKIIIPKEEPLTKLQIAKNIAAIGIGKKEPKYTTSNLDNDKYKDYSVSKEEPKQIKCYCGHTTYCDCSPLEEPKQRLEKYSERFDNKDNELVKGIFNPETWGNRLVDDVPKQETLEEAKQRAANYMSLKGALEPKLINNCPKCGLDLIIREHFTPICTDIDCRGIILSNETLKEWASKEEPKQETLEEAADVYVKLDLKKTPLYWMFNDTFKAGAKWQQERMYSEEDIENIWNEFVKELPPINNGASSDFLVYLKQFKKK